MCAPTVAPILRTSAEIPLRDSLKTRCQSELTLVSCQTKLTAMKQAMKQQMVQVTKAVDSREPAVGLEAIAALRSLVDELEALHVDNARRQGWTWQAIAEVLGITRQSVHKKHRNPRRRQRR